MKITPLDIRKHKFDIKFRGYDSEAVESFLFLVAEQMEKVLREKEEYRERSGRLEAVLSNFNEREKVLKETLYTAQKTAEDQKKNAYKEANMIVKEAEIKSQNMIERAREKIGRLEKDISDLKLEKYNLKQDILEIIEKYRKYIDIIEEEERERDKLEFMVKEGTED